MATGLEGIDGNLFVRVIGRGDKDGIAQLGCQQVSVGGEGFGIAADFHKSRLGPGPLDIADGGDPAAVRQRLKRGDVRTAAIARPDDAHPDRGS